MTPRLVLGVLEPEARSANPFGAFVNRNHFAAWLLMMAAPVGGYLIAHVNMHPGLPPLAEDRPGEPSSRAGCSSHSRAS